MRKRIIIIGGIILGILIASAPGVYFYRQYRQAQLQLTNPTEAAKTDAKDTIAAVGKLMVLPTDEDPTVAMVTDITKLSDQPFFAHAQNGDKVLIYTKSKKAILYRPSANKIIDIAPVNIGNTATQSAVITPPKLTPTESPAPATSSAISVPIK